jgi:general secretion pathway protein C
LSRAAAYNRLVLLSPLLALALVAARPDVTAVGIVMSVREEARTAVLISEGRTRVVGVGDIAFGGRVAAIEAGHVALDFDAERVVLRLEAGPAPRTAQAPAPTTPRAAEPATLAMERGEVERRIGAESGRILAETTLVPAMDAGRVAGFTIARMPDSTLLSEAGLRAGDVLTEVNGVPIDSLATLIGLWPRLQAESAIRAVVVRNGQPVSLSVNLR